MRLGRTHTAVVIDQTGRRMSTKTVRSTSKDHLSLLRWATEQCGDRLWAIEDCRHLSRHLERNLVAAGERIVRVPPKLMANVARAALREPNLPEARLDGAERELRLLVDHRQDLAGERTRIIARLRWHLHELDPAWKPPTKIDRTSAFDKVRAHLANFSGLVAPNWRPDSSSTCVALLSRSTNSRMRLLPGPLRWPSLVGNSGIRIAHHSEADR